MESLNLNTLASSLPSSSIVNSEKELMNNFKAAAMSITTLYRSSLNNSKRNYNAGYHAALRDLLSVIQQGVSVGGASSEGGEGMTIGKIMDWAEARMEAIKVRDEEQDEDESESKPKAAPKYSAVPSGSSQGRDKENTADAQSHPSLPTPRSPEMQTFQPGGRFSPPLQAPSSPSLPLTPSLRPGLRSKTRAIKESSVIQALDALPPNSNISHDTTLGSGTSVPLFTNLIPIHPGPVTGSKRRHAVMADSSSTLMESPTVVGTSNVGPHTTPAPRRRVRSSRSSNALTNSSSNIRVESRDHYYSHGSCSQADSMDVEDENNGRERKRVARR